jgi:hypothetical protein
LTLLGHAPIQTLENGDKMVVAAEQAFDLLLPSILTSGKWRFCTTITQLSQLNEDPPEGSYWTTVYALPAGYLSCIKVYPQNYVWDIYANSKLYTNWEGRVLMEHTFYVEPTNLPPSFAHYFAFEIASYLSLSNAQKPDFYTVLVKEKNTQLAIALGVDTNSRPNFSQIQFPVITNRYKAQSSVIGNT